ncbi:MAG: VPLPA-CTERM sorting domain-containing protein [Alphaproteobacteria bacterium]|nr:VPLPA-CTERM sorting domain-containing protein [Alphaproteobacteria bacterium]
MSVDSDPATLAAATLGTLSGISIVSGTEALIGGSTQQGTYSGFNQTSNSSDPDLALTDGVVLTSGLGTFSTTENTSNSASASTGTGSFTPLVDLASTGGLSTSQNDSNVLSFDFVLDDPTENSVSAQFIFATDEFPTQGVTDIMGVFVNGVNYAFFPNGDLVSNQSGDPNDFFNSNPVGGTSADSYGLEWNGLTDVFNLIMLADGGGAVNTIEIAIADTSDTIFDSALFFTNLTAGTTTSGGGIGNEPPGTPPGVVPIPASLPLLLAGLGAFGLIRRRQSRI